MPAVMRKRMGQRFRLKAGFDISGYSPQMQVILQAMKKYGIIVADNGSDWFISGAPDERWDNDMLHEMKQLTGNDFEADMNRMAEDSEVKRWWKETDVCQIGLKNRKKGEWWKTMDEVYHLD